MRILKLVIMIVITVGVLSEQSVAQGRFSTPLKEFLSERAVKKEYDPLWNRKSITIPDGFNIAQAMEYVLQGTSYRLNQTVYSNSSTAIMMRRMLPENQHKLGDMAVLEAIRVLIGGQHQILIDPASREIGFDLLSTSLGN